MLNNSKNCKLELPILNELEILPLNRNKKEKEKLPILNENKFDAIYNPLRILNVNKDSNELLSKIY